MDIRQNSILNLAICNDYQPEPYDPIFAVISSLTYFWIAVEVKYGKTFIYSILITLFKNNFTFLSLYLTFIYFLKDGICICVYFHQQDGSVSLCRRSNG